jgi:hypothetical protein
MAMSTTLLLAGARELAKLEAQPTWINEFRGAGAYSTYYFCTLSYFVNGDAWPATTRKRPLSGMLFGFRTVDCRTLEGGNFGIVDPVDVPLVLGAFGALDFAAIRSAVEAADPDDLGEEEVDDFELLLEDDEPAADVVESELRGLIAFYKRAARSRLGIVSYTT